MVGVPAAPKTTARHSPRPLKASWPGERRGCPGGLREPPPGTPSVRSSLVGRASRLRDQTPGLFAENSRSRGGRSGRRGGPGRGGGTGTTGRKGQGPPRGGGAAGKGKGSRR